MGELIRAGVHFTLGTDANHGLLWKEVVYAVELGASKLDALKGITVNAAYISGLSGKKGILAEGADADLIAVSGDPLEDPAVLAQVPFVMKKVLFIRRAAKQSPVVVHLWSNCNVPSSRVKQNRNCLKQISSYIAHRCFAE